MLSIDDELDYAMFEIEALALLEEQKGYGLKLHNSWAMDFAEVTAAVEASKAMPRSKELFMKACKSYIEPKIRKGKGYIRVSQKELAKKLECTYDEARAIVRLGQSIGMLEIFKVLRKEKQGTITIFEYSHFFSIHTQRTEWVKL